MIPLLALGIGRLTVGLPVIPHRLGTLKVMRSEHILEIDENTFNSAVTLSPLPTLVDFSAIWCAPCRAMAPHLDAIARQSAGRLRVALCDVDENPGLAARFDVRSMPTFLLLQEGHVLAELVGAVPRARLEAWIESTLASSRGRVPFRGEEKAAPHG